MVRRVLLLVALAAAVVVAIGAGTLLRHQLSGPGPVEVARAATQAYAAGDCKALREVSFDPALIECADVAGVRDAYRSEGLKPKTFQYAIVSRSDDEAAVRIIYERDHRTTTEIVRLMRRDHDWLVLVAPLDVG